MAGLAVMVLAAASLGIAGKGDGGTEDLAGLAAAYASRVGLVLPEGTRVEFAEWTTGLDDSASLGLLMPEAGWASMRTGLPPGAFEAENNFFLGRDRGTWRPESTPGLTSAQFRWRDRAEAMTIGFAPAPAGEVRVFVFWHQI